MQDSGAGSAIVGRTAEMARKKAEKKARQKAERMTDANAGGRSAADDLEGSDEEEGEEEVQKAPPKKQRVKDTDAGTAREEVLRMNVRVLDLKVGNGKPVVDRKRVTVGYGESLVAGISIRHGTCPPPPAHFPPSLTPPQPTTSVGRLNTPTGKVFDQSSGKPFSFHLGKGEVIKGWDIGVQGMRVGGKRRITCPAAAAYGKKGTQGIPGGSTLVFDVNVIDCRA